ncbi:MAG: hypothetical protein EBV07_00725 [Proteobacteria bacterium]|nr:hypothetical protein [Pseudomonadota bacterium]
MTLGSVATRYLDIILGTLFLMVVGFFIMQIVLAAIGLATGFTEPKVLDNATKQLTAAVKGLVIALLSYFLLNTILFILGITTQTEGITGVIGGQLDKLFSCLRDFRTGCGTQ